MAYGKWTKIHKVTVVSSLTFLVAMVGMSSIASNLHAAERLFNGPRGVAVNSSGKVYVVDTGNDRGQKFTNSRTLVRSWVPRVQAMDNLTVQ